MEKRHKKKKSSAMPIAFCCLVIMAIMITLFMMPFFSIKTINVSGNESLTADQVKNYLTFKEGDNIFLFSKSKSRDNILNNHFVKSVDINRVLPSSVNVTVNEYKLRGYVPYSGSYLFIDGDGRVLDVQKKITKS